MICLLVISAFVLVRSESLSMNTSYARLERTASLKCPFNPAITWGRGIDKGNLESITNYKVVNRNLAIAKRMAVFEMNSLIIKNVTSLDFQVYRCTGINISTGQEDTYDLLLKQTIDPSNIRILEETEQHRVIGVIGQEMSITCTVTSGEPEETLIIKGDDGREMVKDGPGSVKFRLKPDHTDDGRNLTCLVLSCDEQVLSYTVQLTLRYKPNITIQAYPSKTIIEGNLLKLRCNDEERSTNVISRYKWLHNGKALEHSLKVMQINVTTPKDNGNFTCTAENEAGQARDTMEINILYAPVIDNYSISFSENNQNLLVNCNASGNPNNFTFGEWTHTSDVGTVIRHLNGSEEGRLNISSFTGTAKTYENGGVYVCNVSNGIHSTDGSLWQTGTIEVIIKVSPVFTEQSKPEQIGYIDNTSILYVDVISSSRIMSAKWFNERTEFIKTERFTMTQKSLSIKAQFHNKMVYTKSYRCDFAIHRTEPKDFHIYIVIVQNEYGFSSFITKLQYAGPPMMPQITSLETTPFTILVKWNAGFDGGHRTSYQIEYRKVTETKWNRIHIRENILNTFFIADQHTEYLVRMKALNYMGHSRFTEEQAVFTEEFINHHIGSQKFIAIFVMLSFLFMVAALVGLRYALKNRRCFGRYKNREIPSRRHEEVSVIPGHYDEIDSMYYNPINNLISSQNHRNIAELGVQQLSNGTVNFENDDSNSSSYQSIAPCSLRQIESIQDKYSARSSTDESYLIPCRMSDLSDNSETNIKRIQRYETLNFPAKNENMYTT